MWQSGLMRVTRNHVPSGAQVGILASSEEGVGETVLCEKLDPDFRMSKAE